LKRAHALDPGLRVKALTPITPRIWQKNPHHYRNGFTCDTVIPTQESAILASPKVKTRKKTEPFGQAPVTSRCRVLCTALVPLAIRLRENIGECAISVQAEDPGISQHQKIWALRKARFLRSYI